LDFDLAVQAKSETTMAGGSGSNNAVPPPVVPPPAPPLLQPPAAQQQAGQGQPRSLLNRVNSALEAIEANRFVAHAEAEDLVTTIAGWMDEAKSQPNEFLRKSMISSIKSIMKQMNMQFTPVQPYDDLVNRNGSKDAHSVVSKIVSSVEARLR
jgi:hypothetical protein